MHVKLFPLVLLCLAACKTTNSGSGLSAGGGSGSCVEAGKCSGSQCAITQDTLAKLKVTPALSAVAGVTLLASLTDSSNPPVDGIASRLGVNLESGQANENIEVVWTKVYESIRGLTAEQLKAVPIEARIDAANRAVKEMRGISDPAARFDQGRSSAKFVGALVNAYSTTGDGAAAAQLAPSTIEVLAASIGAGISADTAGKEISQTQTEVAGIRAKLASSGGNAQQIAAFDSKVAESTAAAVVGFATSGMLGQASSSFKQMASGSAGSAGASEMVLAVAAAELAGEYFSPTPAAAGKATRLAELELVSSRAVSISPDLRGSLAKLSSVMPSMKTDMKALTNLTGSALETGLQQASRSFGSRLGLSELMQTKFEARVQRNIR